MSFMCDMFELLISSLEKYGSVLTTLLIPLQQPLQILHLRFFRV